MGWVIFYRVGYFSITENLWISDRGRVIMLYIIVTPGLLFHRVNILCDTGISRDSAAWMRELSSLRTMSAKKLDTVSGRRGNVWSHRLLRGQAVWLVLERPTCNDFRRGDWNMPWDWCRSSFHCIVNHFAEVIKPDFALLNQFWSLTGILNTWNMAYQRDVVTGVSWK